MDPSLAWFMSPECYIMHGINHVCSHSWGTGQTLINHQILLNVSKHHSELSSSLLLATFSLCYSFTIIWGLFSCTSLLSVLSMTQCFSAQSLSCSVIETKSCSNSSSKFLQGKKNFCQVPGTMVAKLLHSLGVRAGELEMPCPPQPLEQGCHNWNSEIIYWCDLL